MKYIGIDLHSNSFTACYLEEGKPQRIETFPLQESSLKRFIKTLGKKDEIALESTGNSCFFHDQVAPYVSRVVVIAPWQFEIIRRSVKKTDKHDARAIALFLSKDMLPEARIKKPEYSQLASLVQTREQLVKLRVSLINKVHALFNRSGIKIKKEVLTTKEGFERSVKEHTWFPLEQIEIEIIAEHLEAIKKSLRRLEKEIS